MNNDAEGRLPPRRAQDLAPAERRLVTLLQAINFGRLRNLVVRDAQPTFDPPPQIQ